MSGYLNIRNDLSDAQAVILTLDSKGDGSRMGSTLKIDVGRTARVKMPDYLMEAESEARNVKTDSEPTEQRIERLQARIKLLESLQHNHLVAADETDNARMQDLMKALNREQKKTRALGKVLQSMRNEFHKMLEAADEDALAELARTYKIEPGKGNIKGKFKNSDEETQVDMYGAIKASLDDEQTVRASRQHHESTRHLQQDKDAGRSVKFHSGPDSTTDANDVAQTRDPEEHDGEATVNAAEATRHIREQNRGRDNMVAETGTGGVSPTGHRASESSDDESHRDTQERADEMREDATLESDNADAETSFEDTGADQESTTELDDNSQEQENTADGDETETGAQNQGDVSSDEEDDMVEAQAGSPEDDHVHDTPDKNAPHHFMPPAEGSGSSTERTTPEDRPVIMDEGSTENDSAEQQSEKGEEDNSSEQSNSSDEDSNSDSGDEDSQVDDDNFRASVNKLKNAQLEEVEKKNDLAGEGNQKQRKDALKEAYNTADDEQKQTLRADVEDALEG